jgi:hypothetical protein
VVSVLFGSLSHPPLGPIVRPRWLRRSSPLAQPAGRTL